MRGESERGVYGGRGVGGFVWGGGGGFVQVGYLCCCRIFVVVSECVGMWCALGCALLGVSRVCTAWGGHLRACV